MNTKITLQHIMNAKPSLEPGTTPSIKSLTTSPRMKPNGDPSKIYREYRGELLGRSRLASIKLKLKYDKNKVLTVWLRGGISARVVATEGFIRIMQWDEKKEEICETLDRAIQNDRTAREEAKKLR